MALMPTTWDAATKETNATLSGGDLVYSNTSFYSNRVLSAYGATSGKWYWELIADILPAGASPQTGAHAKWSGEGGLLRPNSIGAGIAEGDVLGFALDIDAGSLEVSKNGAAFHSLSGLATDAGDPWLPMLLESAFVGISAQWTANFGGSAFAHSVPSGYQPGFGPDLAFAGGTAPSMLGVPSVFATQQTGRAAAPSMLGGARATAYHDFTGAIGDAVTCYVMDLITPTGTARAPISSWQATLQTGSSNYVQCVIPACSIWESAINSATEFVIYRRAVLPDGSAVEYEMARAPAEQPQFDRGSQRHACTLSGYSDAFAASEDPPTIYDRALTGIRSISSGSSYRVRCAVDWLLRPGHRAFVEGAPFIVKFINYYAPSGFDSYMDVGG